MTHIDLINVALGMWIQPMLMIALLMFVSRNMFMFSAASRHWYFVCVLSAVAAALCLKAVIPNIQIPAIPLAMSYWLAVPLYDIISPLSILLSIYVLGVFWFLNYQVVGFIDIARTTKNAISGDDALNAVLTKVLGNFKFKQQVGLRVSAELNGPVVWGLINPIIILPASYDEWDEGRLERVLTHECAHIERHDFVVKIVGKWFCAILWIVPLVWVVIKRIEWYAELACDDRVISIFDERDAYAEDLLAITSDRHALTWALAFIQSSKLYLRLQYVLDARNYRESVSPKQMILQFLSLFLLIVPIALVSLTLSFDKWDPSDFMNAQQQSGGQKFIQEKTLAEIYDERIKYIRTMKSLIQILPEQRPRPEESVTVFHDKNNALFDVKLRPYIDSEELVSPNDMAIPSIDMEGVLPVNMVMPNYPKKALLRGIEGKVVVAFDIAVDGSVRNPKIVYSGRTKVFNTEVIKAIKKSTFSPMLLDGEPIITKNITETYYFRLRKKENTEHEVEKEIGISL